MSVNAVSASDTSGNTITYTRDTAQDNQNPSIDTLTFLKLLVAQLKYQDPLSPQDNTAFVSQLAQMSSLESMTNMNTTLKNSQAYDLIGKAIYAEVLDKNSGITTGYTGIVSGIVIRNGVPYAVVGNTAINLLDIQQVFDPSVLTDPPDSGDPTDEDPDPEQTP
ncbi:Flagellar hook capping protein-N-terminal region [Sporobacter termitidis DSM 10068]|uniref:Flagellar hook capping protein-N-terminal region n=1 Tax=Sporobacter termitidis DSM 10068 TaxID=1123282 RepID=A0A1M5W7Y3_9FIRM|nr:flagellar hook capping FlgD N-terminal domain-containing protein [Sporobacter termitidis]SHH83699.1 Flagellar hook capping protein-N-terminal region [Sporobacter termitidis DSM 10068]